MFIAISLLFGPLAMDRAMAAAPASTHAQTADDGHCKPAHESKADKAMPKPCCAAMYATAAVVPEVPAGEQLFACLPAIPSPASFRRGVLSEIATPPPRVA